MEPEATDDGYGAILHRGIRPTEKARCSPYAPGTAPARQAASKDITERARKKARWEHNTAIREYKDGDLGSVRFLVDAEKPITDAKVVAAWRKENRMPSAQAELNEKARIVERRKMANRGGRLISRRNEEGETQLFTKRGKPSKYTVLVEG